MPKAGKPGNFLYITQPFSSSNFTKLKITILEGYHNEMVSLSEFEVFGSNDINKSEVITFNFDALDVPGSFKVDYYDGLKLVSSEVFKPRVPVKSKLEKVLSLRLIFLECWIVICL